MSSLLKATLPFLVVLSLLAPIAIYLATRSIRPPASPTLQTQDSPALSVLGEAPDWRKLEAYQESITREDFEMLLTTVFTTGGAWAEFIEINESNAIIRTGDSNGSKAFSEAMNAVLKSTTQKKLTFRGNRFIFIPKSLSGTGE